jgi:hypothetical protein
MIYDKSGEHFIIVDIKFIAGQTEIHYLVSADVDTRVTFSDNINLAWVCNSREEAENLIEGKFAPDNAVNIVQVNQYKRRKEELSSISSERSIKE